MNILVTGGAGYIGSAVVSVLSERGYNVSIIDKSPPSDYLKSIAKCYTGYFHDKSLLNKIVSDSNGIDLVIHMAALISAPDSVKTPELYYSENLYNSMLLLDSCIELNIKKFIFSSSAAVYDYSKYSLEAGVPKISEDDTPLPTTPYGSSKLFFENILQDICHTKSIEAIALRYFNPIGASSRSLYGRKDFGLGVFGALLKTLLKKQDKFIIAGTDFNTPDGTGVRDYIHIEDLAEAHINAIENFQEAIKGHNGYNVFNIGSGVATSVKQLLALFEESSKAKLPFVNGDRREGDPPGGSGDISKAKKVLKWSPKRAIKEAVKDDLKWFEKIYKD